MDKNYYNLMSQSAKVLLDMYAAFEDCKESNGTAVAMQGACRLGLSAIEDYFKDVCKCRI